MRRHPPASTRTDTPFPYTPLFRYPSAAAAERKSAPGQARVCVVRAQTQAIFGAAGEHPIGLADAAGDQIVDEDADVGFRAVDRERAKCRPAASGARAESGFETGIEPMSRLLRSARRAVGLAGWEKVWHLALLQHTPNT